MKKILPSFGRQSCGVSPPWGRQEGSEERSRGRTREEERTRRRTREEERTRERTREEETIDIHAC